MTATATAKAIRASVMSGVTELPPVAGRSYVAFAVHPVQPGRPITLAVAHRDHDRNKVVLDVIRERISIDDSAALLKQYGIDTVTGAPDDGDGRSINHAVSGALYLAMGGA